MSAIAITIPCAVLDKTAQMIDLDGTLTLPRASYFVKARFDEKVSKRFNAFNASAKLECIEEFLALELDFEQLSGAGVIDCHFPLHTRNTVRRMIHSFDHYYERLKRGFIFGTYPKYF